MSGDEGKLARVRFYGVNDGSVGFFVPRVLELMAEFSQATSFKSAMDALEYHNVQQFIAHGLVPANLTEQELEQLKAKVPMIRVAIARYFSAVNSGTITDLVTSVDSQYYTDLLELLGQAKAFKRIESRIMLDALRSAGFHLSSMLENEKLVRAYGDEMRLELLSTPQNAELVVKKYLELGARSKLIFPTNLSPDDSRQLLESYVDWDRANLNYVRLISTAKENAQVGIDSKLKLRAKRRSEMLNAALLTGNPGLEATYEVAVSVDQLEPSATERMLGDATHWKYTYSQSWLDLTRDNPSVLNNFQHLFEFADAQVLLGLPAFSADFGVIERMMGLEGVDEYKHGVAFDAMDAFSLLQTQMYTEYLRANNLDLEEVFAWFVSDYLASEFGMNDFSFKASERSASYLEKVRHLFAELESLAAQFELFAENGELDRELLSIQSKPLRYKEIPSLLQGKYIYTGETDSIAATLHLLFSDQSRINYVSEELRADDFVRLVMRNAVAYTDFQDYQVSAIDYLIDSEVLEIVDERVRFVNLQQVLVLHTLFHREAVSYFHLSQAARSAVDEMVAKSWLTRRSTLFTNAESDYFNYVLNRTFSNGLNLRNQYLHGAQPIFDDDRKYYSDYLIAIRLVVALIIKINDDVCILDTLRKSDKD